MDDRYNYCDVCGKPIIPGEVEREHSSKRQREMETPPGLCDPSPFGDGVIHFHCRRELSKLDVGACI